MAANISGWRPLPAADGDALALDGMLLAVASAAHLEIMEGPTVVASVDPPWPAPGVPRFRGNRVLWGPGVLDLTSGRYKPMAAAAPVSWPGGGEHPSVYAWSSDGSRLVAGFDARTVLLSSGGDLLGPVPTPSGLAPTAAFAGRKRALVDLAGFGRDLMPIVSLSADDAERHLLAVALNQSAVSVDLDGGLVLDEWTGPWTGVAVAPDGASVAVLASTGVVIVADLVDGRFGQTTEIAVPTGSRPARAIAFDGSLLGVCGGGVVAVAEMEHR